MRELIDPRLRTHVSSPSNAGNQPSEARELLGGATTWREIRHHNASILIRIPRRKFREFLSAVIYFDSSKRFSHDERKLPSGRWTIGTHRRHHTNNEWYSQSPLLWRPPLRSTTDRQLPLPCTSQVASMLQIRHQGESGTVHRRYRHLPSAS